MNYSRKIDEAITAAAARRWGSASVQVIRQVESQRNAEAAGSWYVLCVNNEVFCRRREKRELLELLQKANAVAAI